MNIRMDGGEAGKEGGACVHKAECMQTVRATRHNSVHKTNVQVFPQSNGKTGGADD